jgi:diguanylate cyclase (GGDEF)-like protein
MTSQVRACDTVARYGGEEFAIILPNLSLEAAAGVAERIRLAVEQLDLPHATSDTGRVTISIGVGAAVASPAGIPEQLVADTDAALYRAKHAGRNRTRIAK